MGLSIYTGLSELLLQDHVIILIPHVITDMYFIVYMYIFYIRMGFNAYCNFQIQTYVMVFIQEEVEAQLI